MPLTPLGLLNFIVLQWFFVRLARVASVSNGFTADVDADGAISNVRPEHSTVFARRWRWLIGVWPLTGWWSDYSFVLGKRAS